MHKAKKQKREAASFRMTPPPPEYRSRSSLEGYANLQLKIARRAAGSLQRRSRRSAAAICPRVCCRSASNSAFCRVMLVGLLKVVDRLATGDERGVECVEDVRPELERSGLFEFPEVELSHDGRVNDLGGTAAQVIDARLHAHAAVGRSRHSRSIELAKLVARTSAAEAACSEPPCR